MCQTRLLECLIAVLLISSGMNFLLWGLLCVRRDIVGTFNGCFVDFQWQQFLTIGVSVSD